MTSDEIKNLTSRDLRQIMQNFVQAENIRKEFSGLRKAKNFIVTQNVDKEIKKNDFKFKEEK